VLNKAALAETEIGESDMALGVDQDVFRLYISVDYSLGMQVLQRKNALGHVKLGTLFRKLSCELEMVKQLATVDKFHNEIKIYVILEGELQLHHKWMVELLQDFSLS